MAKAKIRVKCPVCGDEIKIETTKNNRSDADRWETWAKTQTWLCRNCEKAEWEAQKDAANKAAAEATVELGLPALTGTEKQVDWANTIRMEFLTKAKQVKGLNETGVKAVDGIVSEHTEAKYWIDRRLNFEGAVHSIRELARLLSGEWVPKGQIDGETRDGQEGGDKNERY